MELTPVLVVTNLDERGVPVVWPFARARSRDQGRAARATKLKQRPFRDILAL